MDPIFDLAMIVVVAIIVAFNIFCLLRGCRRVGAERLSPTPPIGIPVLDEEGLGA